MATNQETTDAELRKEFAELKKQVLTMTELLKKKGEQEANSIKHTIEKGYENAQEIGADGIEKVSGKVKENPFASVLFAFGVGYLLSKSFKR